MTYQLAVGEQTSSSSLYSSVNLNLAARLLYRCKRFQTEPILSGINEAKLEKPRKHCFKHEKSGWVNIDLHDILHETSSLVVCWTTIIN